MISDFHFIRPLVLLLLPLGLTLIALIWKRRVSSSNWNNICDPHLIEPLLVGKSNRQSRLPFVGLMLGWIFSITAIAGPTWQKLPQPTFDQLQGRVIVFDLSRSMNSVDTQPDRLTRARFKLNDLIRNGAGLQQGLVVFAGDAYVVTPLTEDRETIINLSSALDTDTVPIQGSRTDLGLRMASTLLENAGLQHGDIILITDGVHSDTAEVANIAARKNHRVSVLAVGTEQGAPILLPSGEFLKDDNGQIVIPGVNFNQLRQVADAGKGIFSQLTANDSDIKRLTNTISKPLDINYGNEHTDSIITSDQWADLGPWLVLPLLLICAFAFRRGWILSALIIALLINPNQAMAFGWDDLWFRNDQQAKQKIDQQKFDLVSADAPAEWQAAAKYRNGDFSGAAEDYSFVDKESAKGHYNRGNALAKSNAFDEAIAAYDQALQLDADLQNAQFNKEIVEQFLQQQQQQSDQSNNQQNPQNPSEQQNQNSENGSDNPEERETEAQNQNFDQGEESSKTDDHKNQQQRQQANKRSQQDQQQHSDQDLTEDSSKENKDNDQQGADRESQSQLPLSEQQQAIQQWLKRIPDDPGGLLRRKFAYQNSTREPQQQTQNW